MRIDSDGRVVLLCAERVSSRRSGVGKQMAGPDGAGLVDVVECCLRCGQSYLERCQHTFSGRT